MKWVSKIVCSLALIGSIANHSCASDQVDAVLEEIQAIVFRISPEQATEKIVDLYKKVLDEYKITISESTIKLLDEGHTKKASEDFIDKTLRDIDATIDEQFAVRRLALIYTMRQVTKQEAMRVFFTCKQKAITDIQNIKTSSKKDYLEQLKSIGQKHVNAVSSLLEAALEPFYCESGSIANHLYYTSNQVDTALEEIQALASRISPKQAAEKFIDMRKQKDTEDRKLLSVFTAKYQDEEKRYKDLTTIIAEVALARANRDILKFVVLGNVAGRKAAMQAPQPSFS